jgi:branched-chain amino acid transport system substrate-binding protein
MKLIQSILALTIASFCSLSVAEAAETVKIGLLAPLTGFAAADGLSVKNSVDLAVEKVNKEGGLLGKKVELVTYDDRADAKDAVALAQKLIQQDKVVGLVAGSYSMPTRAVAPPTRSTLTSPRPGTSTSATGSSGRWRVAAPLTRRWSF